MTDQLRTVLVRCSGRDRPGITTGLLGVLARTGAQLYDMEQVVVRERLTLDLLVGVSADDDVLKELLFHGWEHGLQLDFEMVEPTSTRAGMPRSVVTVIGRTLPPAALAAITGSIAEGGGNIDRILRLARYPVVSFEFVIVDGDFAKMRELLLGVTAEYGIDVAIQPASLERRAKRLVVVDVDSTLIQGEVVDMLAEEAGCAEAVAELTERAMQGELDFEEALRSRVALLAGAPATIIDRVAARIELTPGARTFVRTLRRLGYTVAMVSGGFSQLTTGIADRLGIDHVVANELEIVDGVLTGRIDGPVVDRAKKADVLKAIAADQGISLSQTVAVGDGANDLEMLSVAGLGIAFNAKPAVRAHADTSLSVPYLDAILFLLGIRRDDVEEADAADPAYDNSHGPVPVDGTPPL